MIRKICAVLIYLAFMAVAVGGAVFFSLAALPAVLFGLLFGLTGGTLASLVWRNLI